MNHVDAISLWHGDGPATRIDDAGRLVDVSDKPYKLLKIPMHRWVRGRPADDVVDWSITVTTHDGDTLHSEVTTQSRSAGDIRLTLPEQTAVFLP